MKTEMSIEKRERKYRAWDKFRKIMIGSEYDGENIGLLPHCDKTDATMYYSNEKITLINVSSTSYDLMEFIGSCNKDNKNIYEHDIVKWKEQLDNESIKRNDEIFGIVAWNEWRCGFVVEQLTKGKWIYEIDGHTFEYDIEFYSMEGQEFCWKDLEVVGNKYENFDIYQKLISEFPIKK